MTPPIVQRLRDAAAAFQEERVSMRAMAQAHGTEAHGTLLLLLAMPCLLRVPGVGTVLGVGIGGAGGRQVAGSLCTLLAATGGRA